MFAQKKYEEASPAEMLEYATKILQLDLKGTETAEEVFALVKAAQPGNSLIFVQYQEPETVHDVGGPDRADVIPDVAVVDDGGRGKGSLGRGDPRCRIMIPATDTPDGNIDVAVGVNGVVWQLKRGVDLDIPLRVFLALNGCVQDVIRHDDHGEVHISTGMRFPVQVTSMPSPEAVAAWQKETETEFCP